MDEPAHAFDRPFLLLASILAAVVVFLAGCAGAGPAVEAESDPPEATEAAPFERRVAPFEVRGADGEPYAFPFLGGLEVPRPQLVDIDDDGDPDLFVQENTDELIFFENTGTPTDPEFTWRTDTYQDLDIGEWYRFADLDEDGAHDLLAEEPYSYIRYYRNTGTASDPEFTLEVDTLKDVDGEALFSDRQNIPNLNDIDCDGQVDLFLGRLDGTITRYEATEAETEDRPRFRLVTDKFEDIEIVAQFNQPGTDTPAPPPPGRNNNAFPENGSSSSGNRPSLHGANSMAFADVDEDGDQDLLWGDFFEPGLLLIENTGSCQTPVFRNEPEPFPPPEPVTTSGFNAPSTADIDGDEDLDLFLGVLGGAFNPSRTAQDNFYFYEQTDAGYELDTRRFLDGIDVGTESNPAAGDIDGDGAPDLLLANKTSVDGTGAARVFVFRNEGSAEAPALALTDTLELAPAQHFAPTLGDLDGDGHADLLVGTWNDGVAFYRNDGTGQFAAADSQLVQLTRGSHSTPALIDIDDDGDLDLFAGEASGTINFYRNTGTPEEPAFELDSDEYADIDVGRRSVPAFADLDGDGLLNLIVGSEEGFVAFRNTGTREVPAFTEDPTLALPDAPNLATPTFVDIDDDGDLDLFTGSRSGGVQFFENRR